MKSLADAPPANNAPSGMTADAVMARTGLVAREIEFTVIPEHRYQLGMFIREDVYVANPALTVPHIEPNAEFFLLLSWGSTWEQAATRWIARK